MDQSSGTLSRHTSLPPLAGLEVVRAVSRHRSLTAAAGELGLTTGALSRRVAAVEAWLGMSLFERHGRGMRPTPDGQRFLSRIEEAFALIETAAEPWRGRKGTDTVRISVLPSFARLWLLPRLQSLELGPEGSAPLRIEIAVDHRNADVEGGEVDAAIRYGLGIWKGTDAEPLLIENLVPIAHPELAARLGAEAQPKDLLCQTLLCDSDALGWRAWLGAHGIEWFRPRPHDRRFEDYGLVLAAAQAGLGVALARMPFAATAVWDAGLVRVSRIEVPSPLKFYLVTRHRENRPTILEFCRRLRAASIDNTSGFR